MMLSGLADTPDGALCPQLSQGWVPLPVPSRVLIFWSGSGPNPCFPGTLAAFLFPWPAGYVLALLSSHIRCFLISAPRLEGELRGLCVLSDGSRGTSQMKRGYWGAQHTCGMRRDAGPHKETHGTVQLPTLLPRGTISSCSNVSCSIVGKQVLPFAVPQIISLSPSFGSQWPLSHQPWCLVAAA